LYEVEKCAVVRNWRTKWRDGRDGWGGKVEGKEIQTENMPPISNSKRQCKVECRLTHLCGGTKTKE